MPAYDPERNKNTYTMKFNEYKGLDLAQIAADVLGEWDARDTFHKSITTREGHPAFVFYEGPPSANGMPGIHHVMARTIKDVFCRYKTQQGYLVHRKAGWDTHGLPVELGVEKKLGITKEDIGRKISIEEYNRTCREAVMEFTGAWEDLTRKMGYWVNMDDPYITYDNKYIETLWWLLKQLFDKGLLYKGYTIQPYSPAAGTGLSTHELNQPGCYRDVKDTTCTAQFRIIRDAKSEKLFGDAEGPLYFLAWTTTPWTLPSNTALAVGPAIEYVKVKCRNPYTDEPQTVILAKDLVASYFTKKIEGSYQITGESWMGPELEGIRYEQLIPWVKPTGDAFRVIVGDYVTTSDGTGIVHIAPTFGADDDRVAKAAGIAPLFMVDKAGKNQPMVDKQGKFFVLEDLDPEFVKTTSTSKIQGVCGPLRQERLRPGDRLRCRDNARHRPGRDAESPEQGIQDRKAYPLLPPLLAYGQAGALLPARFVVHPHHGAARADDRAEQDDPMETRIDRDRPFRQMARRAGGLEPFALALLGHTAAGMGYGGLFGTEVHRFDQGADG